MKEFDQNTGLNCPVAGKTQELPELECKIEPVYGTGKNLENLSKIADVFIFKTQLKSPELNLYRASYDHSTKDTFCNYPGFPDPLFCAWTNCFSI